MAIRVMWNMMPALLWILALACVLTGVIGTVLPMLPGAPLVFAGLVLASWADNFQRVGWFTIAVLGFMTILALIVDFLATSLGAKRVGASKLAIFGALAGTIIGIFFALPGLIIGPFLGALAGQYLSRKDMLDATKVGLGTWIGLMLGTVAKLGLVFAMIGVFFGAYLL